MAWFVEGPVSVDWQVVICPMCTWSDLCVDLSLYGLSVTVVAMSLGAVTLDWHDRGVCKSKDQTDLRFDLCCIYYWIYDGCICNQSCGGFCGLPSWAVTHFQSGGVWVLPGIKWLSKSQCIYTLTGSMFVWSKWYMVCWYGMLIPVWLPTGLHLALSKEVVWASGFRVCVLGQHLWWIGF